MSYTVLPASYRKNPKLTEPRAQLQNSVKKLRILEAALRDDSLDLGQAWVDYRGEPVTHVPANYRATFHTIRYCPD
jgi:hypothetical protein